MSIEVARFAPVDVEGLVAEAALLTRVDRKYLLDRRQAEALVEALDARTRVLSIEGRRVFRYSSTYFDTPDLLSFHLAAHGRRRRFKVRTRSYLDSGGTWLEVKTKGLRGTTVKDRVISQHPDRLDGPGRDHVAGELAPLGVGPQVVERLGPVLRTTYRRVTFAPPGGGTRVTLDTDLGWHRLGARATCGRPASLLRPDLVVLETKSGTRPGPVDRMLWRAGHRPQSLSKFGTGLAALDPDLPSNHWARVLGRHFGSTPSPASVFPVAPSRPESRPESTTDLQEFPCV